MIENLAERRAELQRKATAKAIGREAVSVHAVQMADRLVGAAQDLIWVLAQSVEVLTTMEAEDAKVLLDAVVESKKLLRDAVGRQ